MATVAPSPSEFEQMFPRAEATRGYFFAPGAACDLFSINTRERIAAFLAELDYESAGLTRLEERFVYTAERLMEVWPFRFRTIAAAREWAVKKPEAIASYVYANRMGNGSPKTGDGWNYRGRGFVQLTGKNNYAEFGEALGLPLVTLPHLAAQTSHAAVIAGRFWATRGCNEKADVRDLAGITRAINGGTTGLKERTATWRRFRLILGLPEV